MPMTSERKDQQARNRRHWETHLKAAARSGLNRAEYCRQHKLSYHALSYWHKRLSSENSAQTFVPVKMALIRNETHRDESSLRVILPGKFSVAVGDDFSAATLDRLLTVLESR
jgi:transposase